MCIRDRVELAQTYMVTNVIAYPLLTLVNVVRFMIQGMGFSMFAILAGVMAVSYTHLDGKPVDGCVIPADGKPGKHHVEAVIE